MKHSPPILALAALLALACSGCEHGPKSAKASPPPPARVVSADAIEKYEAAVQRLYEVVADAEQVGNVQATVDRIEAKLAEAAASPTPVVDLSPIAAVDTEHGAMLMSIEGKLDALLANSLTPLPASPVTETAPEAPATPARSVTLHGKPINVASYIREHYRSRWTHPGTVDEHLAEHGVAGFAGLDNETKEKLHSAIHEAGVVTSRTRTVTRSPAPQASNCPGGVCPSPQRYGMFGRAYRYRTGRR